MYNKFLLSFEKKLPFSELSSDSVNIAFPLESNVSLIMLCLINESKNFLGIFSF